jgi:hypothetical protein
VGVDMREGHRGTMIDRTRFMAIAIFVASSLMVMLLMVKLGSLPLKEQAVVVSILLAFFGAIFLIFLSFSILLLGFIAIKKMTKRASNTLMVGSFVINMMLYFTIASGISSQAMVSEITDYIGLLTSLVIAIPVFIVLWHVMMSIMIRFRYGRS